MISIVVLHILIADDSYSIIMFLFANLPNCLCPPRRHPSHGISETFRLNFFGKVLPYCGGREPCYYAIDTYSTYLSNVKTYMYTNK